MGISGVNFGIAETGTILIVENEGNIRLTTSLPRIHIAVMGIEKVIPRFADLDVFLKLLPRSGTGQSLTTYQSFITGVKKDAGDEGPEELHVVLLDNGRSRMLAHPVNSAIARVHSLRSLFECVSGVSADRWSRVRVGVSRTDWRSNHPAIDGIREGRAASVCIEFVWCLS